MSDSCFHELFYSAIFLAVAKKKFLVMVDRKRLLTMALVFGAMVVSLIVVLAAAKGLKGLDRESCQETWQVRITKFIIFLLRASQSISLKVVVVLLVVVVSLVILCKNVSILVNKYL